MWETKAEGNASKIHFLYTLQPIDQYWREADYYNLPPESGQVPSRSRLTRRTGHRSWTTAKLPESPESPLAYQSPFGNLAFSQPPPKRPSV